MPKIYFLPDKKKVETDEKTSILEASLNVGIPHTHVCGGKARCSTCRVMVLEGIEFCTPRTEEEQLLADRLSFDPTIRLACQTKITGNVNLRRLVLDEADAFLTSQLIKKARAVSVGEEKKVAILFSDIRGFTTFAEALVPYDVIHVLNRYFHHMDRVIIRNGGYIDNYMGDGLLALFGIHYKKNPVLQAVKAGLDMLGEMKKLGHYFKALYRKRLQIDIGIHYGEVVVGTIGTSIRSRETIIGDSVNFASRIEAVNKRLGTNLLISQDAYEQVKNMVLVNKKAKVRIRGKTGKYTLYEVVGLDKHSS